MPKKGYKQTENHKLKITNALCNAHKEKQFGFEKGNTALRFSGKHHTEKTKKIQSDQKKINNPMWNENTRKKLSETRIRLEIGKGPKNVNWKGGISPENVKIRGSKKCRSRSEKGKYVYLNVHHIIPFSENKNLRFDINNGETLCKECHKKIESERMMGNFYGKRKTTIN